MTLGWVISQESDGACTAAPERHLRASELRIAHDRADEMISARAEVIASQNLIGLFATT